MAPLTMVELFQPFFRQNWQNSSISGAVFENGASSEGGANFFLNMVVKVAPFSKMVQGLRSIGGGAVLAPLVFSVNRQ